jgi:hypothetical protein
VRLIQCMVKQDLTQHDPSNYRISLTSIISTPIPNVVYGKEQYCFVSKIVRIHIHIFKHTYLIIFCCINCIGRLSQICNASPEGSASSSKVPATPVRLLQSVASAQHKTCTILQSFGDIGIGSLRCSRVCI